MDMKKRKFTETEILRFLRQAQAGLRVQELCRSGGFSDTSFYKWRAKYGIEPAPESRRLLELEGENAELKRLLAEAQLRIHTLKCQFDVQP